MNRVALEPSNEAQWLAWRTQDITSTESAALFGLSPYATAFELWHRKHDKVAVAPEPTERMEWGTDLQDAIALSLARRYGVKIVRITEYMRIPNLRMGSSFDFEIVGIDQTRDFGGSQTLREMFEKHGPGLLEIKNVDASVFRDQWERDDRSIEPPGHIDIQLQHQLHVRQRAWGAIGVLVGGNRGKLVIRMRDEQVGAGLETRISQFWASVDADEEPAPIYPGDAEFVASLYKTSVDKVFDGRGNEALDNALIDYKDALERETLAKEDKKVAQAKALRIIGSAERAYTDRFTVSSKEVGETVVPSYTRSGYRGWRVTQKKGIA